MQGFWQVSNSCSHNHCITKWASNKYIFFSFKQNKENTVAFLYFTKAKVAHHPTHHDYLHPKISTSVILMGRICHSISFLKRFWKTTCIFKLFQRSHVRSFQSVNKTCCNQSWSAFIDTITPNANSLKLPGTVAR